MVEVQESTWPATSAVDGGEKLMGSCVCKTVRDLRGDAVVSATQRTVVKIGI